MLTRQKARRLDPLPTGRHRLSSRSNPTVKLIRALRERKERERTGLAFVEGIRIVTEALDLGASVEALVVAPDLLRSDHAGRLVDLHRRRGLRCIELSAEAFRRVAVRQDPDGVGALVRPRWTRLVSLAPSLRLGETQASGPAATAGGRSRGAGAAAGAPGTVGYVALHEVQYAGNLGTIIRTADAAGVAGIILVGHTADPYDPAALRASVGAVFALPLVRTTADEFLSWRTQHGLQLVGTSPAAATDYGAARYRLPATLLMGSERHGLPPPLQAACDLVVRIPMAGRSDSLNLAVATGVVLYAMRAALPEGRS